MAGTKKGSNPTDWRTFVTRTKWGSDGLKHNNWWGATKGDGDDMDIAWAFYLEHNQVPTQSQFVNLGGRRGAYSNIIHDIEKVVVPAYEAVLETTGFDVDPNNPESTEGTGSSGTDGEDAMTNAMDAYFRDQFSLQEGTSGKTMLNRLETGFANQAQQEISLADAQYQQQALQQAQVVKSITDQIRSERMARLRSGMSESQIANQDMQMLLANTNALNENAAMMNQGRLAGQANLNTSRDQAYMQFLESSAVRGQVGAANYASSSSNPNYISSQRLYDLYGSNPTLAQKKEVYNNTMGLPKEE